MCKKCISQKYFLVKHINHIILCTPADRNIIFASARFHHQMVKEHNINSKVIFNSEILHMNFQNKLCVNKLENFAAYMKAYWL